MVVNSHPLYRLSYWGMKNGFLAQRQHNVNILLNRNISKTAFLPGMFMRWNYSFA
jgi:hypothetical protein